MQRTPLTRVTTRLAIESLEDRIVPANLPPGFVEQLVADDLLSPIGMQFAPDGRLFITEQQGAVRVVENGVLQPDPFIVVTAGTASPAGEQGLLGITFHPNFTDNGIFYLYYTLEDSLTNRISLFRVVDGVGDPSTEQVLIEYPSGGNHNAGAMRFGPDGKLYIATGDTNRANTVQSLNHLNGKMLRLNADGSIPVDNPFYTVTTGINRAIWALGLRNPFTFDFNPIDGRMFINDVGQEGFEEINEGVAGANFGWPLTEGPTNDPRFVSPIYSYAHNGVAASIAGAAFYVPEVANFPQEFVGDFFFADFQRRNLSRIDPNTGAVSVFATGLDLPVGLSVGPDGALYYLGRSSDIIRGRVIRISFDPESPPSIFTQPQSFLASATEDVVFSVEAYGPGTLEYQWQRNGVDIPQENGPTLTITNVQLAESGNTFRVIVKNEFGNRTSQSATLTVLDNARPTITILSPAEGFLFEAGTTYSFSFFGEDLEDGILPRENSSIRIDYHTGGAVRPFLLPLNSIYTGFFTIPNLSPYKQPDVFYRLHFSVIDSSGLTATATRDLFPRTAQVTVQSDLPRTVRLDGQPIQTPTVFEGVTGLLRTLEAVNQITVDGQRYRFVGWSNGQNRLFEFPTPASNTIIRARYELFDQPIPPLIPPVVSPTSPTQPVPDEGPTSVPFVSRSFAVTPSGGGRAAEVRIFNSVGPITTIQPFGEDYTLPIRATVGSIVSNKSQDLLVAAGPGGGPILQIYEGASFELIRNLIVFEDSFRGGLYVATGDLTGDGFDDIIVSADSGGGSRIRVFNGQTLQVMADFFGIEDVNFRGGARVSVGDVNGDGRNDLIVAAGAGGGPRVALFDGRSLFAGNTPVKLVGDFFVFEPTLRDGVNVALGDVNGDGFDDIVIGSGIGGAPRVLVLDGQAFTASAGLNQVALANFFNGDPNSRSGVTVAVRDLDGNRRADLILGNGGGTPFVDLVQAVRFNPNGTPSSMTRLQVFELDYVGGIFVG